jgi:restriction system protein
VTRVGTEEKAEPISLSPEAFEREVKNLLDAAGSTLLGFESKHRAKVTGVDGTYEIDILARFPALGVEFKVLIECKHQREPVKREVVQVLNDRIRSVGAQKGLLVATTRFQRGAIEYAQRHGIALIQLVEGRATYFTRDFGGRAEPPPWANLPPYAGWMLSVSEQGGEVRSLVSVDHPEPLQTFLSG